MINNIWTISGQTTSMINFTLQCTQSHKQTLIM